MVIDSEQHSGRSGRKWLAIIIACSHTVHFVRTKNPQLFRQINVISLSRYLLLFA